MLSTERTAARLDESVISALSSGFVSGEYIPFATACTSKSDSIHGPCRAPANPRKLTDSAASRAQISVSSPNRRRYRCVRYATALATT